MNSAVSTKSIREALAQDGQPREIDCPYAVSRDDGWSPSSGMVTIWRLGSTLAGSQPSSELLAAISASQLHVLVLNITESFFTPNVGTSEVADDSSRIVGMHAVVVMGDGVGGSGEQMFLVRNSWGASWGDGGHAWLLQSYIDTYAHEIVRLG